jgi:hypothetical protein
MKKRDRYLALAERAIADLEGWLDRAPLARISRTASPSPDEVLVS